MAQESRARQQRPLRILLIEDDPIDAAWVAEHIRETRPGTQVKHSASLRDALSVLAQYSTDAVFISVYPDGRAASIKDCCEAVCRANPRPVVALVNPADMGHADDVRAAGVRFIYRKHPIMRTGHIRKLEVRERVQGWITEHKARTHRASAGG